MNTKFLGRSLSLLGLAAVFAGCATKSNLVSLGNDTYSMSRQAGTGFDRDTDRLKDQLREEAEAFTTNHGKQLKVIDLTVQKPLYLTGYINAKIVFKALNPGDPELTTPAHPPAAADVAGAPAQLPPAYAPPEKPVSTDDLYAALMKLDELRKKGILTDEEFQAEKQKLLNRSK